MIAVTIVFGCIACFEWSYLRRRKRSKRSFRIVIGFLSMLWMFAAIMVLFRERFSLGTAVSSLFKPLQRLLLLS